VSEALQIKSLAPILVVSAIEPSLEFWEKIGFSATVTVPDAPPFGFAIVAREGIEVMLQTRESVKDDMAGIVDRGTNSILYVSVAALDPVIEALAGAPVAVPRRRTFYGADEIFLLDPSGNVIGFSAQAE